MALVRERDGRRLHVKSKLMGESLVSKSFVENLKIAPQQRLFPDVNILKIGGQSICDRGIKAIPSIIKEIVANKDKHKMLITTGGGTRSRHIYSIALELGMPTGIIAKFGSSISEQNALLIATLLYPWGGIKIGHDEVVKLATYFAQDCIPVMHGMPPYDYFAIPPKSGRIPIHRTDVGTILLADLIGARSCIFVKDEMVAYTIGERLDKQTLVIHFEKGNPAYKGVYQAINQMFLENAGKKYQALQVVRTDPRRDRQLKIWLLSELNNIPVLIEEYRDGKIRSRMQLESVKFNDEKTISDQIKDNDDF